MKQLSQNEMYDALEDVLGKDCIVGTVNEFYGQCGEESGFWLSAEQNYNFKDEKDVSIFAYWSEDDKEYPDHIYKPFSDWLDQNGWWVEFNDAGTVMLYPR